jgi:hypothetical protein
MDHTVGKSTPILTLSGVAVQHLNHMNNQGEFQLFGPPSITTPIIPTPSHQDRFICCCVVQCFPPFPLPWSSRTDRNYKMLVDGMVISLTLPYTVEKIAWELATKSK